VTLPAQAELRLVQDRAAIDLFEDRMAVHWTPMGKATTYYAEEGLVAILSHRALEEGSSFTTSLNLSFPLDNHAPVGLVFRLADLQKLGYRHLDLKEKGRTPMELIYELNYGKEVSLNLMRGVVSYNPSTLRSAVDKIRACNFRARHQLVPRPRYDMLAYPRQWESVAGGRYQIVDLPELA
jgi:hypothetical protein